MTEMLIRLSLHDERALHALLTRRRRWLDRYMCAVTHLGGATASIVLALTLLLAPLDMTAAGALGAFALALSHGLVQVVKRGIHRERPRLPVGFESLARAPDRFSFPSGHSASSLAMALPLGLEMGGLAGLLVVAVAATVGVSRCYIGVHYPGDVLAGWILALISLWTGTLIGLGV